MRMLLIAPCLAVAVGLVAPAAVAQNAAATQPAPVAATQPAAAIAESHPAQSRPVQTQALQTPSAVTQPAATRPLETQPIETRPAETQPAETQPAETQPAETQPAETQPAETQPAETQPAQTQPAGPKPITWDVLYGEDKVGFSGKYATGLSWLDDGRHYLHRQQGKLMRIEAQSGEAEPAFDTDALKSALLAHPDFDEQDANRLAKRPGRWSEDRTRILIKHKNLLYIYTLSDRSLTRITKDTLPRREVTLSASASFVTFVRDNDLYVIDVARRKLRRLTRDGSETILNGILDWVYQEEIYGRGGWRGYWVHPQDKYVAYLQLDESAVPAYTIVDEVPTHPPLERTNYPKAGDPNPGVRLGIVRITGGRTRWVDLSRYAGEEILIVDVSWSPDGMLLYSVQDREQRWLELCEADPRSGRSRLLIREISPAWTNRIRHPLWLGDGRFVWLSERDGWRHAYLYARDGRLIRRLTGGTWEVRTLHGVDEQRGWVYFSGSRDSLIERHAYRVPLAGGRVERLTEPGETHRVRFDPTFTYFLDTYSNISTPPKVALRHANGNLLRMVSENDVTLLDEYVYSEPEFVELNAADGFPLTGMLIRPPDFDPQKSYPVWCYVYGGPGSQTIRNGWSGRRHLHEQMLAQMGYMIWYCDPRSASGRGAVSHWQAYRRLGQVELADIEDGVRWLIEHASADPDRIGIYGHSYGGFMTAYALTHSEMFRMGIAGAPVTDWRNYDTIYTERYMRTPQHNPDGYDRSSAVAAAADLHGRLLLVHGLKDDNVHFQNAAQLIRALHEHKKMFDLMVYPLDRHGIWNGREHYRELSFEFLRENL